MYVKKLYSVLLAISCVYTYYKASVALCSIFTCASAAVTDIVSMYSRSIAFVCLISRITILYKSTSDFPMYRKKSSIMNNIIRRTCLKKTSTYLHYVYYTGVNNCYIAYKCIQSLHDL